MLCQLVFDSMKASILARQTEKMAYVQQTIQIEDEIDDLEEELREKPASLCFSR